MAITITKLGNQAKLDTGVPEKKYYDCLAMANSFSVNANVNPFIVSSRLIEEWGNDVSLSDITIVATTTHSSMTTLDDWKDALADLSKLST